MKPESYLWQLVKTRNIKGIRGFFLFYFKKIKAKLWPLVIRHRLVFVFILLFFVPFIPTPNVDLPFTAFGTNGRDIIVISTQSLTQVLGIIGALILITFQFQRKSFSKLAFQELLKDGILWEIFVLYLGSIIYGIVALLSLNKTLDSVNMKFAMIEVLLFLSCLMALIPLLKKVLTISNTKIQAQALLDKLTSQDVLGFRSYGRRVTGDSNFLEQLETNPIVLLTDGAISSLVDGDELGVMQVIAEVTTHLTENLQKEGTDRRSVIEGYLYFFRNLADQAAKLDGQRTIRAIIGSFEDIHFFAATNKLQWDELIEFNQELESLLFICLQKSQSSLTEGLFAILRIQNYHLEHNTPLPSELLDFDGGEIKLSDLKPDDKDSQDKGLQWDHVRDTYIGIIMAITSEAISSKNYAAWSSGISMLVTICNEVLEKQNLSTEMKSRMIGWAYFFAREYLLEGINESFGSFTKVPFPFRHFQVQRALQTEETVGKEMMVMYSETLLDLAKLGVLNDHYLNEYAAFGRRLTRTLSNRTNRQAFTLVVQTLDSIRQVIEDSKVPEVLEIYPELYKQAASLKTWLENKEITSVPSMQKKVVTLLAKFDQELVKSLRKEKYTNIWPNKVR